MQNQPTAQEKKCLFRSGNPFARPLITTDRRLVCRFFLLQFTPLFATDNMTHAGLLATAAGMLLPGFHVKSIVERQLIALIDFVQGMDVDALAVDPRLAIRVA